jgi:hypothetical protein
MSGWGLNRYTGYPTGGKEFRVPQISATILVLHGSV